ncbi:MAG: LacI family DNA-binding transcriptional regulator [Opitutaceae bacterium]|jgi:LacI family transcriptional regulator
MSKQPTILDVAKKCGFSKSTVSLVLQNSTEIPESTKAEVFKAMEELGYRRNRFARSLRTRRSHAVGIIVQDLLNPFYIEIVQHVEQLLRKHGYDLIVTSSNTDPELELPVIERLVGLQVDGLIVSTMDYERVAPRLKEIQEQGTQCVIAGPAYPGIPFDAATIDDADAMREAMEHLFALGHRDIGFIWGAPTFQSIGVRFEVFRTTLERAGLSVRNEWVMHCGFRLRDGYDAAKSLLSRAERPSAVFALNDMLAMATIRAARDLGLSVPGDVSVVGVDNVELGSFFCPSLTTIASPITAYAEALAVMTLAGIERTDAVTPDTLCEPLRKGRKPTGARRERVVLRAGLVVRESTGEKA